jgi:predicted nucleic acid-binding protein
VTAADQARLVLDASALVDVLLRTPNGRWFRDRLDWNRRFYAPELLFVEVAQVLRSYELRKELSAERATTAFERMLAMPLSLVSTSELLPEAWTLRHHVIVPDASYVVLARRLGAILVTSDKRLAGTHNLGVATLTPPDEV